MTWTSDAQRAAAFRDLVLRVADTESYLAAVEQAARVVASALQAGCIVALDDPDSAALYPLGIHHEDQSANAVLDEMFNAPFARDRGYAGAVMATASSVLTTVEADEMREQWPQYAGIAERFGVDALAVVPIRKGDDDPLGVIWLGRRDGEPPVDQDDVAFAEDCAAVLALAVTAGLAAESSGSRGRPVGDESPDRGAAKLSARETEILGLIAQGHTNREVAERLVLSVRTVEWHRARIQWKLGTNSRAELTRIAREQRITT